MAQIFAAFRDRPTARRISAMREASSLPIFRAGATGSDVTRAFHPRSDSSGTALAGRTANSLCEDLGERARMLAAGRLDHLICIV